MSSTQSDASTSAATTSWTPPRDRPLDGRTAFVTGGSRGIGAAISRTLAARGADVHLTYHSNKQVATALVDELRSTTGVAATATPFNIVDPVAGAAALDAIAKLPAQVDIVVVNAAAPYPKAPLQETPVEALTDKVAQDLRVLHHLATGLMPGMLDRGFGRVVVIGSLHADGPSAPGMAANGVAKAALTAYVDYAVDELTGPGVTINTVLPGYIATDASAIMPPAIVNLLGALTPAERTGQPNDVAAVVAMLVGTDASFVNGARIPVSGGLNHPASLRRIAAATRA